ncbi:hypothetical protein BDQ17DRAFT_580735 [Cyathus striatus]|nr:hypothetical protein BDQ17DRAFT_1098480 [Cyathus striatus]KAF9013146.1 hypothetical protein BDQ17DRAFT_580735 [Cyathus striatus]
MRALSISIIFVCSLITILGGAIFKINSVLHDSLNLPCTNYACPTIEGKKFLGLEQTDDNVTCMYRRNFITRMKCNYDPIYGNLVAGPLPCPQAAQQVHCSP